MEYVEMIKDQELVLGFQELVTDADTLVVKRAVKVFTCVYHHTLRLLSLGELEEEVVLQSWSSVNGVVDRLLAMVRQCNNEGILIHLLRFLEAAVTAHLTFDVTKCPRVFERGRDVIKSGLKALKDLVTTPYVGGSSFIYGVRALISIACLRPDLWEPVTDLLKKQLASLPPTLFDHNVRSLNKALQKNLFRLLRRADKFELKEKLIEMMVSVGVPRKAIAPWAPQALTTRKRSPPEPPSDLSVIGRQTPPEKKLRLDVNQSEERDRTSKSRSRSNTPEIPTDPRVQAPQEEIPAEDLENSAVEKKSSNADFLFLTSLIPKGNNPEPIPSEKKNENFCSENSSEKDLYSLLNLENVCSLVIQNINDVPDTEPKDFIMSYKNLGIPSDNINIMRSRLSSVFDKYIDPSLVKKFNFKPQVIESEFSSSASSSSEQPKKIKERVNSSSSSTSSTPASSPAPTPPLADTDMRQVYQRSVPTVCDVDMRISDPRLANRDPRLAKDPRSRRDLDCRSIFTQSMDPRLDKNTLEPVPRIDPRTIENSRADQQLRSDQRTLDPRANITRVDPRTVDNLMVNRQRIDPRTLDNQRIDPRTAENQRVERVVRPDPRNLETSRVDQLPRIDPRNEENLRMDQAPRTDPRTIENPRMDHMSMAADSLVGVGNMPRMDPRLSSDVKRNTETRKTRWDPRPDESNSSNRDQEYSPPQNQRTIDPRMNRNPSHGQGLLPHPDPRMFQRENMDPRFPFQKHMNHGELQSQPNFMSSQAPPFPFNTNNMSQFNNPFLGNLAMPPHPNSLGPMFNNLPFGWENNLRNSNPTVILAQTLAASVQQGLLSPKIMNH